MTIRPATPADIAAMRGLEQQADITAHWSEREYRALFETGVPPRIALVAGTAAGASNLEIEGFLIAGCQLEEWELENIVIAAGSRRRGIASALIQELLRLAAAARATSVLLEVRASNQAALKLYEGLHFVQDGRRAGYYEHPTEDAILLRRRLSGM